MPDAPGAPTSQAIPSTRSVQSQSAPDAPATPVVPPIYAPPEPAEAEIRAETKLRPAQQRTSSADYIPLPGCPHPALLFVLRWSSVVVPALVGGLTLALAIWLVVHVPALGAGLSHSGGIPLLFAIYVVGGALFGVALYFAPTDGLWFAALVLGGALLSGGILFAALGVPLGIAPVALLLGLAILYLHGRRQLVEAGSVLATRLGGRYYRVLRPGDHLRLPGERVVATLETAERTFITPTQYGELESRSGTSYRARAACTTTYAPLPEEAQRLVSSLTTWERDLQQLVAALLREAIHDWGTHVLLTGQVPAQGMLARGILDEARTWAHARGIWITRVRVHNIWLEPTPAPGQLSMVSPFGAAPVALPPSAEDALPAASAPAEEPNTPGDAHIEQASEASAPLSPDVLAMAYEAVRDGRISDPATIREIARAFASLSEDSVDDSFPYDAEAASRILWDYASQLEQQG
jgi:hypothetical protein